MNGSLIIASYAAIVATAGVIWQLFLWRAEHAGRLSVDVDAYWSLDGDQNIRVFITNRNSYDVPLTSAGLTLKSADDSWRILSIDLDTVGLAKVIPARNSIGCEIDEKLLTRLGARLYKVSEVEIVIFTGVGRRESSSAKVLDGDKSSRQRWARALGGLSEVNYGDIVRVRATPSSTIGRHASRTGTIKGFSLTSDPPTFKIGFDDNSFAQVPITSVELVTKYDDRLEKLD
jgi:hypothetical protein